MGAREAAKKVSRIYGESITTEVHGGSPVWFDWRGDGYVVLGVQEHWVISREWWQRSSGPSLEPELEFWRVRASPDGEALAVYELRHHVATGTWLLVRVWD
ncbi:MAG: DUF6504 family protein [Streptosporangiaceae bacterium]